jgi:hypothetical protein
VSAYASAPMSALFEPDDEIDHIGVVLLTIAGWCLNRAMGVPAPVWSARR